jgi:hypothetical protein
LYRCGYTETANNGFKKGCNFEHVFLQEGSHHCPLCGNALSPVSDGPSVSEVLRKGQRLAERQKKEEGKIKNEQE